MAERVSSLWASGMQEGSEERTFRFPSQGLCPSCPLTLSQSNLHSFAGEWAPWRNSSAGVVVARMGRSQGSHAPIPSILRGTCFFMSKCHRSPPKCSFDLLSSQNIHQIFNEPHLFAKCAMHMALVYWNA